LVAVIAPEVPLDAASGAIVSARFGVMLFLRAMDEACEPE